MSSPISPVCKSPLSPVAASGTKRKARGIRPLPLYTEEPGAGEVALPSQGSDIACMNLVTGAGAAARRARSPQGPPSYETLYSPCGSSPVYTAIAERIEFLESPVKKDEEADFTCPGNALCSLNTSKGKKGTCSHPRRTL